MAKTPTNTPDSSPDPESGHIDTTCGGSPGRAPTSGETSGEWEGEAPAWTIPVENETAIVAAAARRTRFLHGGRCPDCDDLCEPWVDDGVSCGYTLRAPW